MSETAQVTTREHLAILYPTTEENSKKDSSVGRFILNLSQTGVEVRGFPYFEGMSPKHIVDFLDRPECRLVTYGLQEENGWPIIHGVASAVGLTPVSVDEFSEENFLADFAVNQPEITELQS